MRQIERARTATEERNLAAVRRMYASWNGSHDRARLHELVAPDLVNHAAPPGSPPGRDSFEWLYRVYRAAFRDVSDEPDQLMADGDKVAGRVRHRARHVGEYFGIPATGLQVDYTSTYIWRLVDGRVVELWGDTDRLSLLRQLGARVQLPEGTN